MRFFLSKKWELSTDHAFSSYLQPVLVNRKSNEAFGPDDVIRHYPSWGYMTAREAVKQLADKKGLSDKLIDKFLNL